MSSEPTITVRPTIGVSAIIFDSCNRVLLVKRGNPPCLDQWHAPGGKLEAGESMVEACIREVREETGIEGIRILSLIAVAERQFKGFHYVILDFLAKLPDDGNFHPKAADDVADARWVTYAEIDRYDLVEGLRPIIEAARLNFVEQKNIGLFDATGRGTDYLPLLRNSRSENVG